jgi:hypothetical protein
MQKSRRVFLGFGKCEPAAGIAGDEPIDERLLLSDDSCG